MARVALQRSELNDTERIHWLFRRAVSRGPKDSEVNVLIQYLSEQRRLLGEDAAAAERLAPIVIEDKDRAEVAAWTGLCSVILNLHEFIVRE